jgi:hypothetical protein
MTMMSAMTTTTETAAPPRGRVAAGRLWRIGVLAAAVAAGGNALVYTLARAMGVALVFPQQSGTPPVLLPVTMVIAMSVTGAVAGTVGFALFSRFARRGVLLFQMLGVVCLLLSFGLPLSLAGTDGATKATLVLMHTVAGGSIIGLLGGRGRRSS